MIVAGPGSYLHSESSYNLCQDPLTLSMSLPLQIEHQVCTRLRAQEGGKSVSSPRVALTTDEAENTSGAEVSSDMGSSFSEGQPMLS